MAAEPPPNDDPLAGEGEPEPDDLQKKCDDEYAKYLAERETLRKSELEAEKNYDTLLVALSTLAIGSSFTIFKDIVQSDCSSALIILAWIFFGLCLLTALYDRILTYKGHKKYRELLDNEFTNWEPGALERGMEKYMALWWRKPLPYLKWIGFGLLGVGLIFLMMFVFSASGSKKSEAKSNPPVIVNVYNGTPTTAPSVTTRP